MSGPNKPRLPITPVVVKRRGRLRWPKRGPKKGPKNGSVFYVLASNGLMICRDGEFFRSCAPARGWPPGLSEQKNFLAPRFPKLSRRLFERVVGFFDRIAALHGSEAAVLLVWNRSRNRVGVMVPRQTATVQAGWSSGPVAIGLEYYPPADLGEDMVVFGDIHSHVEFAAYASATDRDDESYRAGLHVVVGRLSRDEPDIHVEAVADGTRFPLEADDVLGGYRERRFDFPASWIDKVEVETRPRFVWPVRTAGSASGRSDREQTS